MTIASSFFRTADDSSRRNCFVMHLDRTASVSLVLPLMRAGFLHPAPGIPILMYHSISDDPEPGVSPYYRLTTSPARFREQMEWLREYGYAVIDLNEAIKRLNTGSLDSTRHVVLTFDDGFRDFEEHAWPILAERKFAATVFLPTAFIGSSPKSMNGRDCLTWPEIRALHRLGVSFGSHTVNHPVLHHLPQHEIRRELRDSRLRIERELQSSIGTFAYPFAFPQEDQDFMTRFRQELLAQGYGGAVTTAIGRMQTGSDPLLLKRLPISQADDEPSFVSKLLGAYDWLGRLNFLFRTAKMYSRRLRVDGREFTSRRLGVYSMWSSN
jgi:peptidoglycan/xylan/chitin deacetylase (PgdA/CDA1 family)